MTRADDESLGPAAVIHSQIEKGHDVHLLTLTRGGAGKVGFVGFEEAAGLAWEHTIAFLKEKLKT